MGNKIDNIFGDIVSEDNLFAAYRQAIEGDGKYSPEALIFSANEVYNLRKLRYQLVNDLYRFSGYISLIVTEPKVRKIDAPHFVDKIVQLAINNVFKQYYNKTFIYDSYASIDNKGTHKCAIKIHRNMKKAKWEWGSSSYIVKGDIKQFFHSIDREVMKSLLAAKIKDKRALSLIFIIIDSANELGELGLPLGNTLSQLCANIYMNELDQYCVRVLKLKYYVRYMDDFFIVVNNREKAREVLKLVRLFVGERLNLELNERKSQIFPLAQGVNGIGFKTFTTHVLLREDSKVRVKRRAQAFPALILGDPTITHKAAISIETAEQMLNSWKSHADFACSKNFVLDLIANNPYLHLISNSKRELFRINKETLELVFEASKVHSVNKSTIHSVNKSTQ